MHVLIADDDPVYQSLLSGLLSEWRFQITTAGDGLEAWEAIQRDPTIRLAILDWLMPGMDGFQVCTKARNQGPNEDLYILIVTGSSTRDDIMKVVVAGADDYLIKPFQPFDLKIRLRNAIRILQLQEEAAALRHAFRRQASGEEMRQMRTGEPAQLRLLQPVRREA